MPDWKTQPPAAFDIVAAYFPETKPKGEPRLRPCLVLNVLRGREGALACRVAFGTTNLKFVQRQHLDLIIQNSADLSEIGLPRATRFDLDPKNVIVLPWRDEFFGCWSGYSSPVIGRLTENYIKDLVFNLVLRETNK